MQQRNTQSKPYAIGVLIGMGLYCLIMIGLCFYKYSNLLYDDFDLAVHTQSVRNILHGSLDSSILGIPFLGNHMVLILFLLAPFYALMPSPLLLLTVQTIVLAAGAWGIYLLAKREINERWGLAFALIYLCYPPLIYLNLYEFHPIAVASGLLIYAFYFYRIQRHTRFWIFAVLACLCQENVALIVAGFGAYALVQRRNWRWIVPQAVSGLFLFVLFAGLIMPGLNDKIQFLKVYAQFGDTPPAIAMTLLKHPANTLTFMFSREKLDFLNLLAAPLGYLSLLNPFALIPATPVILQRLLSARPTEASMIYHYQAELIPFIFSSAVLATGSILRNIRSPLAPRIVVALLTFFPIASIVLTFANPSFAGSVRIVNKSSRSRDLMKATVDRIPSGAPATATFELLPPLAGRDHLYSLHHIYYGKYTLSTIPYPPPADTEYILLNTHDSLTFSRSGFYGPWNHVNIQTLLSKGKWQIILNAENYVAFQRTSGDSGGMVLAAEVPDLPAGLNTNISQPPESGVTLVGFTVQPQAAGDVTGLDLYWRMSPQFTNDFDAMLTLWSEGTPVWQGALAPGSRIWPPQSWLPGRTVHDIHGVCLPAAAGKVTSATVVVVPPMLGQ
ncbi:MAG: hypothetical protein C0404_11545 [Verrucomicrobia bacterium]|nr:hypothetical protein [Verrucomicrobiota bacterium]